MRRPLRTIWLAVLSRLAGGVFVLWAVATLTFFAIRLIPGDPAQAVLGGPGSQASAEALAAARAEYGLDRPLFEQYLIELRRLATLDFGSSYSLRMEVGDLLLAQLPGTLLLAVLSLAVAWVLALAIASWSSRGGVLAGTIGSGLEVIAAGLPHFWLATLLILIFSTALGWLPPISVPGPVGLILPVITLAVPLAGFLGQVTREALLDALDAPFSLSARARGESEGGVQRIHALRHAALPGIALSGWAFGYLISGAVVVETVFARPGLGRSLLAAVTVRDVPVVIGVVMVVTLSYVLLTVLTDAVSRIIDPRLVQPGTAR